MADLVFDAHKASHPIDSGDPQRLVDYWTGRLDQGEYGQDTAYLRGRRDEAERMAAVQRRAMRVVHAAARMPVREPLALTLEPDELREVLADRDRVRGEAFRAGLRVGKAGSMSQGDLVPHDRKISWAGVAS